MACNGMASSFFPPNFLLQMQTATHGDDDHHHQYQHAGAMPPSAAAAAAAAASYGGPASFQTAPAGAINPHDYHALGVGVGLGVGGPLPGKKSVVSLSGPFDPSGGGDNGEDDLSDDCSQAGGGGGGGGEKKRRLNVDQVRTLERNFELGNKLEPERKMQLARALGLQPRQIAIWFQNRRARWKTKQLEKDYDALKKQFDAVKSENDALHSHNKKLQAEIIALRGGGGGGRDAHAPPPEPFNLNKETEGTSSNRSDNSSADVHLDISRAPAAIDSPLNPNAAAAANCATSTSRTFFASIRQQPQQLIHAPMPLRPDTSACPKIEHHPQPQPHAHPHPHDESFCGMFCSIDDQAGFWAGWPDTQQSFAVNIIASWRKAWSGERHGVGDGSEPARDARGYIPWQLAIIVCPIFFSHF